MTDIVCGGCNHGHHRRRRTLERISHQRSLVERFRTEHGEKRLGKLERAVSHADVYFESAIAGGACR